MKKTVGKKMQHVVLWSAMRSGSTEFAKELAHKNMWTFADEPFNSRLSKYNPSLYFMQGKVGNGQGVGDGIARLSRPNGLKLNIDSGLMQYHDDTCTLRLTT